MYQQTVTFDPGVLSSLRIRLKKNNFHNFDDLLVALQFKDKVHFNKISDYIAKLSAYHAPCTAVWQVTSVCVSGISL